MALDMVEALGTGEVAVKGEIPRNLSLHDPVHQLLEQLRVILERRGISPLLPLAKAAKLQRIMFPRRTHVMGDHLVVGHQVALIGMVPEPTHVLDHLSARVDQGVVDGHHPAR